MQEQFCNQCGRHCPVNNLHCGRGRAYFEAKKAEETQSATSSKSVSEDTKLESRIEQQKNEKTEPTKPLTIEEKIIENLRILGHFVHEGRQNNHSNENIFSDLTQDEKNELLSLLEKINKNTKNSQFKNKKHGKHHHGHHRGGGWHKHKH